MRIPSALAGALALGLFVSSALAQEKPASIKGKEPAREPIGTGVETREAPVRMVIANGPLQTVHYFSKSRGEQDALRALEQSENQLSRTSSRSTLPAARSAT